MTAPIAAPRPRGARLPAGAAWPALVVLATALVGFLVVSQVRGSERFRQRLEAENEEDLTRILASLTGQADALGAEVGDLRLQLANLEASSHSDVAAAQSTREQLQALQVLSGTTAVTGPGVVLEVDDPGNVVAYDALIDVVQELRDAGAEAIAVNGRRVGVASALSEQDGGVALDGADLAPPYRVNAIGQPDTLESGLKIPGGALDALDALKGVRATVVRAPKLDLPALEKAPALRAAHPVSSQP